MPGMDGIEATRRMRECEVCDQLPPARIVSCLPSRLQDRRPADIERLQIAVSGLDSTLGQHSTVLSSGQGELHGLFR
jgi:CheY-like chemotaxis protein